METTRRDFIKTGSTFAAGKLLLPGIQISPGHISIPSAVKSYLTRFEVTTEMLQKIIDAAMSKGGDYADLFFEDRRANSLGLEDGKVNRAYSDIGFGVGIRVLKGDQTGFAYSETVHPDDMLQAAGLAANIAGSPENNKQRDATDIRIPADYYNIKKRWEDISAGDKVPFVQKMNDKIFLLDEKVIKVNAFLNDETSHILFYNSDGLLTCDYRPMVSFGAVCIMQKDGKIENSYSARSFREGYEWLSEDLVSEIAGEVVDRTSILFEAIRPQAGEMPVVMGAGSSGILLHEAIGHTFEADFNRKGTSIFSDKLGKKIAADFVDIVDDGTLMNNRGSINIDDEGNETQKTYLVKNGILNSYIHDRISAAHYGVRPTGNGRRQSFRYVPLPRMRATYMENGPHTKDEIIMSVKNGIYVDNFSNGEVKIGAGDFTFFVKSGYLIENGRLTRPVKDINIIGNGPQALSDITMVANDYLIDNSTWTCGKDGQSVPVTCGLPTVLVKKLTVGGSV